MSVAVEEVGLVTSVGRDAATACAAVRAGLVRPSELLSGPLDDLDEQRALVGHPMRGYTDGYHFVGRWARLAAGAVRDVGSRSQRSGATPLGKECKVVVALPNFGARYPLLADCSEETVQALFRRAMRSFVGEAGPSFDEAAVVFTDEAGTVGVLDQAAMLLRTEDAHRVLVLFVDSYVDAASVRWLQQCGRFADEDQPSGLQPGEAGAAVVLIRPERAEEKVCTWASAGPSLSSSEYPAGGSSDEVDMTGHRLASVLRDCLQRAGMVDPFEGALVLDLNGEHWKAKQFGGALSILGSRLAISARDLQVPCSSVGFVGCATLGVALALAFENGLRQRAGWHRALLIAQSHQGSVGCILYN